MLCNPSARFMIEIHVMDLVLFMIVVCVVNPEEMIRKTQHYCLERELRYTKLLNMAFLDRMYFSHAHKMRIY